MRLVAHTFALFGRRKDDNIAERTDSVLCRVLFDIGPDSLLHGSMALDRQYRMRFYSTVPQAPVVPLLAVVALNELPDAHLLRDLVYEHGIDADEVSIARARLAQSVMRTMAPRVPGLRVPDSTPVRHGMALPQ